ncbi:MAG: PAS domain-containing sensor histidine kinase [Magnetococcales bacterium]|nr:PAS domain-containing sensor histidine kinase [Magnetococcales bacterium]
MEQLAGADGGIWMAGAAMGLAGLAWLVARGRRETAAAQRLARAVALLENSGEALAILDLQGRHRLHNERWAILLNVSPEQLTGVSLSDLLGADQWSPLAEAWNRCLAGAAADLRRAITFPGGRIRSVRLQLRPRRDPGGRVAEVVLVCRDIGADLNAARALADCDERFARFMDHLPGVAYIKDGGGRYLYVNTCFLNLTGREELTQVAGRTDADLWPPDRAYLFQANDRLTLTTGRPQEFTEIYPGPGGETHWRIHKFPIPDAEGRIVSLGGIGVDVTEKLRTEEEMRSALHLLGKRGRELAALNAGLEARVREEVDANRRKDLLMLHQSRLAAMGEMVGNIAHQWRQPLNALNLVLGNLRDAQHFGELTPQLMAAQVARGDEIIQRMSATIDDFRHFFKPDKVREPFDARVVIERAIAMVWDSFAKDCIDLVFQPPPEGTARAMGLPNEYAQAILALLGNAREAVMEGPGGGGRVEVGLSREDGWVVAVIADDGVGVAEDIRERIFEPYFTTKQERGGSGIGLYMAKTIIEQHMQGRIEAERPERGARFCVRVPEA